ncbi:MAG: hypothetical protein GY862_18150 [Gammaproteobacteria bacterium]|nr:hypothetical protein [Gammaproteobacteria bacterium]
MRPKPSGATKNVAMYIAMAVRNAMEDFHHKHLSDKQMEELNPIIRNAICTAFHAFLHAETSDIDRGFVTFHTRCIPKYWEEPELNDDYIESWEMYS